MAGSEAPAYFRAHRDLAAALSLKDWKAKSDREQKEFLSAFFARLVIAAGKTDRPLADKITSYYGTKAPDARYPQGYLDLTARIGRLEQQAKTDRSVDLSKLQIEDVILQTTAEHFGMSYVALSPTQKTDIQLVAPPKQPSPPPKGTPDTTSGGFGDLIGDGGFIKPPEMTPAVCVPPDLVNRESWENPAPGSDMEAFKDSVMRHVMSNAVGRQEYLIRHSAFDDFVRSRRSASPSTLVELIPVERECGKSMCLYRLRKSSAR